ncbi:uncharacterized protein LOC34620408 [Cyclospora cayetanensis]|uniref:Uncharacterized protein LOC34620408 n=1 Tax=Cyclospora cayetanensis TaxID=88456 RepID=A0A6P6RT84_9EIME|nr:uncharacterized protein LOC34620408 [Cyclospora cayetanensis]
MGNAAPTGEAGFRVLRIQPGTPAETADFELFFDFIIQIENESLCSPDVSVQSVLKRIDAAEGRPMRLTVYNARHRMNREVYVQPARAASSLVLLGVSLQYCPFEEALSSPLRVLGVLDASPAQKANLQEGSDYILGDEKGAYRGVSDLIMAAEEHMGSSLTLFVFNKDTERVRRLVLQPCDNWGGEGCLGCDVGSGFLHRVPFSRAAKDDADVRTAAAVAAAAVPSTSAPPQTREVPTHLLQEMQPPQHQQLQHQQLQQQQQQQQQQLQTAVRPCVLVDGDCFRVFCMHERSCWIVAAVVACLRVATLKVWIVPSSSCFYTRRRMPATFAFPQGTSTAAAAVAAGLRMSPPLDVPDPTTDVLASCLLLPTTNSPLRDPTFAGATWGAPLVKGANVSPNGQSFFAMGPLSLLAVIAAAEAAGATFALDGFGTSAGDDIKEVPEQQQQQDCAVEHLLQQRNAAFASNAKSAYLAYDLPYAAAMMSHSEAVIEGKPQPSTVLRPTAAAYDWLVSVVSLTYSRAVEPLYLAALRLFASRIIGAVSAHEEMSEMQH